MNKKYALIIFSLVVVAIVAAFVVDTLVGGVPTIANRDDAFRLMRRPAVFYDRNGQLLGAIGNTRAFVAPELELSADLKHALLAGLECLTFLDDGAGACANKIAAATAPRLERAYAVLPPEGTRRSLWQWRVSAQLAALPPQDLLAVYAHAMPYGTGVFGIAAAAHHFYGVPPAKLTVPQCAVLAGLAGKSDIDPTVAGADLRPAAARILDALLKRNLVEGNLASLSEPPPFSTRASEVAALAGPVLKMTTDEAIAAAGKEALDERGLRITTTLDLGLQEKAIAVLRKAIAGQQISQGSLVMLDAKNREVIAFAEAVVGGGGLSGNLIRSAYPVGTIIKPFLFLAGLEDVYNPSTLVDASATSSPDLLREVGGDPKGPFMSQATYRLALGAHLVPPALRIAAKLGPETVASTYRKVGLTVSTEPTLREVMGVMSQTFLDLVNAYAIISQKGIYTKSTTLLNVTQEGKAIVIEPNASQVVTEPPTAFVMAVMLRDEFERPPYNTADERFFRNFYGKAGAAVDGSNTYFIGFNGRYLIALHAKPVVGDTGAPKPVTGSEHAMPIWAEFVRSLPDQQLHVELERAFGTYCVGIDPVSGLRTEEDRPRFFSCYRNDMRSPEFTESKKTPQLPSVLLD